MAERNYGVNDALEGIRSDLDIIALAHAKEITEFTDWKAIRQIVRSGLAKRCFAIGDQLMVKWNNGSADYELPWDVVDFGDAINEDGETIPGLWLQSHYALEAVQFDGNEGFYVAPDNAAIAPGTYHFKMGNGWGTNVIANKEYQFTLAQEVPAGGMLLLGLANSNTSGLPDNAPDKWRVRSFASGAAITPIEIVELSEGAEGTDLGTLATATKYGTSGMNNMQRAAYGYNRWSQSAMRQWLNSDLDKGLWWTPQNPFDHAPDQLATLPGFLAGLDPEFVDAAQRIQITTALNTVSDSEIGATETTFDKFFLPSLEQEYTTPQLRGVEGAAWDYWKKRLGTEQGTGTANARTEHIRYAYNAKTSAQTVRLRSAYRGTASNAWSVNTSGSAHATYAIRPCPACVIC